MPPINLPELRAEMEGEREWREREMRLLRNQLASLADEAQRCLTRKALVVMLYAHFEGATKAILTMYVNRLNGLGLRASEAASALAAAALSDVFHALREPHRKCKEFARTLPDDSSLHRFARDRDFVEAIWLLAERNIYIDADKIVDTDSNLKPAVLRRILYRLGLNPDLASPWERTIHQLLNRRNDVAHGSARNGVEEKVYAELEQAVKLLLDGLVNAISDAVVAREYLSASHLGALVPPSGPLAFVEVPAAVESEKVPMG